ncbi:T9SS type A sorting domain-containing protein [Pedobacter sp. BS3]|uniref:right-handed parallel beta-helix repeat-containing protein n=1 Tax=Pedobacter sp. BS3 TaxID=2567937 RepID=UPI0011EDBAEF|nr:right-handed parallel beta-helix repeat-containing protein [Pedobacter sp. BS3]TZF84593.1 T9SS type A sorting domain-containing protein [Pedobacter sp. BS3]
MKKLYFLFIVLFAITVTQAWAQATTYYVKPATDGGDNNNNGLSWATAKATIAGAITAANPANGDMIFVAKGTYTANSGSAVISPGAKVGLKFYGGFTGTETSPDQRVFGTTSADSTNLVGNNFSVITNYSASASAITTTLYDGFTIKDGNRVGNGGGMYNQNIALITVTNCIFKNNKTTISGSTVTNGGGMWNSNSDVNVSNCIFVGNTSSGSGASIYNTNNQITVTDCKFYGNTAQKNGGGGLLASTGSSATITNCVFEGNKTNAGNGAAVSTYHTDAANPTAVSVSNCTFTRNAATGTGGGMYNYQNITITVSGCTFTDNTATTDGGGIFNNPSANATITDCTFTGNIATQNGGGLYNSASANGAITNCTFTSNIANNTAVATGGGGLFSTDAGPVITYCKFIGNKAANGGSILLTNAAATTKFVNCLFSGNMATNAGGASYINNSGTGNSSTPSFINCTIAANYAKNNGGGLYNTGSNSGTTVTVTNCIIYGNSSGIANNGTAGATATVTYSNVQYTGENNEVDYSSGTGNFNVDPKFTSLPAYSSTAPVTTGDYTLQNTSQAINAGDNNAISGYTTDLLGSPRVYNDVTVDMGAYEYQGVLPVKLSSFTAQKQGENIQLSWATASETNNSHFEVLRSDGSGFKVITTVQGNGTSDQAHTYSYTDTHPLAGVSYYQLRQVDVDGQSELSEIIPVKMDLQASELKVYASTAKRQVAVWFYTENAGAGKITITDVNGRKIASGTPTVEKGYNKFELPARLQKGVNILALTVNGEKYTAKFIAE